MNIPFSLFPTATGTARFFLNNTKCETLSWKQDAHSPIYWSLSNNDSLSDREDRFLGDGFLFYAGDDGTIYHPVVRLRDGEPDPVGAPTAQELKDAMTPAFMKLTMEVGNNNLDPMDLEFARQLLTNPACFLRVWQKYGTIEDGQMAIADWFFTDSI